MDRCDRARQAGARSAPEKGVDAIVHMAEVVQRMDRLDRDVFSNNADPLQRQAPCSTPERSAAGTDYATYPSRAVLGIEIGTQPGEHLSDRVREIEAIFAELSGRP